MEEQIIKLYSKINCGLMPVKMYKKQKIQNLGLNDASLKFRKCQEMSHNISMSKSFLFKVDDSKKE